MLKFIQSQEDKLEQEKLPIITEFTKCEKNDQDEYLVKLDVPQLRLNKYNKGIGEAQKILMDQKNENIIDEKLLDSQYTVLKEEITGSKELTCIFHDCSITFKR